MTEKEYIEREAGISGLDELEKTSHHNSVLWPDHVEECREVLRSIPAADVRPVVRGKWHSRFYYRESTESYDCEMHVCSECGSEWSYDAETGSSDFNYCPNCGAKMEEI